MQSKFQIYKWWIQNGGQNLRKRCLFVQILLYIGLLGRSFQKWNKNFKFKNGRFKITVKIYKNVLSLQKDFCIQFFAVTNFKGRKKLNRETNFRSRLGQALFEKPRSKFLSQSRNSLLIEVTIL